MLSFNHRLAIIVSLNPLLLRQDNACIVCAVRLGGSGPCLAALTANLDSLASSTRYSQSIMYCLFALPPIHRP